MISDASERCYTFSRYSLVEMNPRPASSPRLRLTSPPPSKALLDLQKQGLELAVSPPPNTLSITPQHASGRSTPSDLDKPLPLEPSEGKRRTSSVYSTDTTISNILRMYGEYRNSDELSLRPILYQPQAYRDTVAPLLIRRLSLSQSPSPQPISRDVPREAVSNSSLRSTAARPILIPSNKTAPSFAEFSRQLQQRRNELVSPLSASSADFHRQAAYDQLAPPSPQVSSVELSITVSHTPPLPDAMSVTISDPDVSDLLPPPLGMSSSSLPSPPYDDWEKPAEFNPAQHHDQVQTQLQRHSHGKSWSHNWLEAGFASHSPESSPVEMRTSQGTAPTSLQAGDERDSLVSYTEQRRLSTKKENLSPTRARHSSARSSVQQGVSTLLRSLSRKNTVVNKEWPKDDSVPSRERQLAKPATPYQVYGAEVFSNKLQKKQQRDAQQQAREAQEAKRARRQRGKSVSLASAYGRGQDSIVSAMRKLTRKSSQKRQRRLKESIIIVGPTETTKTMNAMKQFAVDSEEPWI